MNKTFFFLKGRFGYLSRKWVAGKRLKTLDSTEALAEVLRERGEWDGLGGGEAPWMPRWYQGDLTIKNEANRGPL